MELPENIYRKESAGNLLIQTPGHGSYLAYIRVIVGDLARKVGFDEGEAANFEEQAAVDDLDRILLQLVRAQQ